MERQFLIRRALPTDAPSLSDFAARQFRATYDADTSASDLEAYVAKSFTVEKQSEEIESPDCEVLLAVNLEQIIGYAHVQFTGAIQRSAFLNRIYVDSFWKGRAVGSALLNEIIENVRGMGMDRIRLTVYERNARAIEFYRKAGFEVIGTEVFQVGEDQQNDLVMERRLA